ncbi:hypothetical protein [Nakamurella endophytica]|uniref:Uncharacterized protein n=1 Tax=Nakamurella endophytica TaxID=1748367 RepID=A0A917SQZ6_9ACTN|nr:hypothetical protein [Nakamurella endophytica]GGL92020.1 hypothetical protein GCM10011594_09730 [Nakamurella endophytica]
MTAHPRSPSVPAALPRIWAAATAGYGLVLLAGGERASRWDGLGSGVPPAMVRLLGGRLLVQSGLVLRWPIRPVCLACAAVEALHAASMAVVAVASHRFRRAAAVSGSVATCSALAGLRSGLRR